MPTYKKYRNCWANFHIFLFSIIIGFDKPASQFYINMYAFSLNIKTPEECISQTAYWAQSGYWTKNWDMTIDNWWCWVCFRERGARRRRSGRGWKWLQHLEIQEKICHTFSPVPPPVGLNPGLWGLSPPERRLWGWLWSALGWMIDVFLTEKETLVHTKKDLKKHLAQARELEWLVQLVQDSGQPKNFNFSTLLYFIHKQVPGLELGQPPTLDLANLACLCPSGDPSETR